MRIVPSSLLLALSAFASAAFATAQAPALTPAPIVMQHVETEAAAEHKNILLTFSASWCGPCKMFERFVDDPAIHPIMVKAFVIDKLDVGEHPGDTKHANSPGGEDLMATLGGKNVGYPFIVMLNPAGKPIVSSLRTGKPDSNVGYPALPIEVDWFMQMLQKAAPSLTSQETTTIHSWLTAHGQN